MNQLDKAWMAAVIENRGKIHFTNDPNRKTNQLVLRVVSKKTAVIERLATMTGTKPNHSPARTIEVDRRACAEHCGQAHVHTIAEIPEMGVWAISGVGAAIVLHNLHPHFMDDAGIEALVANLFAGLPTAGRGRAAVDHTIVRLRRLGWKIPPAALEHFVGTPTRRGERGRFVAASTASTAANGDR